MYVEILGQSDPNKQKTKVKILRDTRKSVDLQENTGKDMYLKLETKTNIQSKLRRRKTFESDHGRMNRTPIPKENRENIEIMGINS